VVVRPRRDVETDRLEVLRDAGRADDPDAAELACGTAGVAARSIAVPSKLPNAESAS
jgi:hypothetical protein